MNKLHYDGPVVLAILDGVGLAPAGPGNAISIAKTEFLAKAAHEYPHLALSASGEAVGLLPGIMGNSEVGHNTIGSGQIIKHGIARINEAFSSGAIFNSDAWKNVITRILNGNPADQLTLHFAGIFSDGGVHSDIAHLEQMIKQAYREGIRRMRVHAVFDGRDVPPQSEPKYIERFETFVKKFPDADIKIASGGGRMTTVADRYENDWEMVKRGFDMMYGRADYYFHSAKQAILALRRDNPDLQDQDLPAFVIVDEEEQPVGKIKQGDALIYFDFRADRAVEIAEAFTSRDFTHFNREGYQPEDVFFVGLTEYNSDTHIPEHRLVEPIQITDTLNQFLGQKQISELAVSETVKFGHVTYYFNGNSYTKAPGEEHIKIDSYPEPFEAHPNMRSAEIADEVIKNLDKYQFVRLNFPGGDMIGHTANIPATTAAIEAIDVSLAQIAKKVDELGGILIITADHGNAEELLDENGNPKTAHTTNLVPCIFYDNTNNKLNYQISDLPNLGLANLASTVAVLLGQDDYPTKWHKPLITVI